MNDFTLSEAWPILVPVGLILLLQGTWLFLDARKHGGKAWFWGCWGLIQFPLPLLTYSFLKWRRYRRERASRITNHYERTEENDNG